MTKFEQFTDLHYGSELFKIPNAWNAKSAQIFEEQNYKAIATSSAAVAASLGYDDRRPCRLRLRRQSPAEA